MPKQHIIKKKKTRAGGARPGAGRPPLIEDKVRKPVTITVDMEKAILALNAEHSFSQFMCAAAVARLKKFKAIPDVAPPRKRADYKQYAEQLTVSKMVDMPKGVADKIEKLGFYISPFICKATEQYIAHLQKKKAA